MARLGINVPNFGPEAVPEAFLDWARFAEHNGLSTLVVSDHVAPTAEVTSVYPAPFYDPFVLLSWLFPQTERIRLGTSVAVLPYRHPLLTARMSAMLQLLSQGRFVLGVGSGWAATEFAALGLDVRQRGRTTDSHLGVITRAWAADTVSSSEHGFSDVATGPAPLGGGMPVWVGGAGRAAIRRAARFGTAWHPINPTLDWLRNRGLPALTAAAAEAGRPVPALVPRIKARLQARSAGPDRPLGVGTLAQIVGDVRALTECGAAEIILDPNPDVPTRRDFAAEQRQLVEIVQAYRQEVP
ncbi:TIGR03619 family F420-dependent LLM class oxidoreductase [Solwaraspora sp. WMMA2080]|uniref:TIGR03619 family F420-dependent LLM class oxidoreductase n=1 Tax=unclassified Solwaraspora TaxID=2627926 RepID=UPI00248B8B48|nr:MULTISPECIES: TIGR03619 family F420-dependent LLM class oxidoreductase [unclassified Solwaraspora]WBB95610.1 TIGR03619 family F420-dependent LLM class oxidoreductase [Solwaraspora sp. WMMA2059]WBC20484.1 TIGR03619 family F420-dependent LLM class oxidoreductase [Solwaraspora sp. WMMA2080]